MEGHSIQEPVHATVQMATVGLLVEVSTLCGVQMTLCDGYSGSACESECARCLHRAFIPLLSVMGHSHN